LQLALVRILFLFCWMKTYFINLVNYDHYANGIIFDAIIKAERPEKAVQLMAHLLAAQQIWLNRCKGLPALAGALWPDWPTDSFPDLIAQNHKNWLEYLEELQPEDFDKLISYKNSRGLGFENKLTDVLAHLINHGTHHRAQVGQQLKLAGLENLPNTDYIFYLRNL
jgi:uncharacterized damage-inducible protein DinB